MISDRIFGLVALITAVAYMAAATQKVLTPIPYLIL